MSESVVIQCPKCQKKLRIRSDKLGTRFRCPGCQNPLSATPAVPGTTPAKTSKSQRPDSSSPAAAKSSSRPQDSAKSPQTRSAAVRKKKKSKPDSAFEDPWADETSNSDDESYLDSDDLLEDDEYQDSDDGYDSPPSTLPNAKVQKNKKESSSGDAKKKTKSGETRDLNTGFFGWVLAALIGGAVSILLTTLLGYQPIAIFIYLMAIATGALVGGSVRYAAGVNDGWGPGLVAAFVALASIFGGRVGAFYVSPEMSSLLGDENLTPAQIQTRIDEAASEDAMIAIIAAIQLQYNPAAMAKLGVTEEQMTSHSEEVDEDTPHRDQYLPQIWDEAARRWNLLEPAERESRQWEARITTMADYDVLDEATLKAHIGYKHSDFEMIKRIARELSDDGEWRQQAGIPDDINVMSIDDFADGEEFGSEDVPVQPGPIAAVPENAPEIYGFHQLIWKEALSRWSAKSEDARAADRTAAETEIRELYGVTDSSDFKDIRKNIRIFAAFIAAIVSMFLPIWGFFFCTCSGVIGAFKLGSGMTGR